MRQIFTVRFFAALGAIFGLLVLLTTFFQTKEAIDEGPESDAAELHRIDLVSQVFAANNADFRIGVDGEAINDTTMVLDAERSMQVVTGTPGVNQCPEFPALGACAIVADMLGEGVVWFALVPMGPNNTVELPAIDSLDDGLATLVNGWQLSYAPVLDRRCPDDFASYREFRDELGDRFISIYGIEEARLVAVDCRTPDASPSTT